MTDDTAYQRARARAAQLRGFYINVASFIVVNIALFLINVVIGPPWWFYWALVGWGIGVLFQAYAVFIHQGIFSADWEERKAQEIMAKQRGRET